MDKNSQKRNPILMRPDMLVGDHNIKNYFEMERNLSYFPPLITTLIVLNILIFFWSSYTFIMNPSDNIIVEGQFQGAWLFEQPIRIWTSKFLHGGLSHLFGNMAMLFIAGIMVEHLYGTLRTLAFYLAVSVMASLATGFFFDSHIATIGASGSVFGVVGLLIAFYIRYHNEIFIRNRTAAIILILFSCQMISQGFFVSYVNNAAHVGGLLTGLLFGFIFKPHFANNNLDRFGSPIVTTTQRRLTWVSIKILIVATVFPFYLMQSRLSPWGNISFWDNLQTYVHYLLNPPKRTERHTNYWTLTPQEPTKINLNPTDSELDNGSCANPSHSKGAHKHNPDGSENKDSQELSQKSSDEETGSESKGNSGDGMAKKLNHDAAQKRGAEEQGLVCQVCVKGSGKPCVCDPRCRWTLLHHYSDENCKIKILTNVWGPNTGSPFKRGFSSKKCVNYIDRSYSWEHPRQGCYAPTDKK